MVRSEVSSTSLVYLQSGVATDRRRIATSTSPLLARKTTPPGSLYYEITTYILLRCPRGHDAVCAAPCLGDANFKAPSAQGPTKDGFQSRYEPTEGYLHLAVHTCPRLSDSNRSMPEQSAQGA